jgi:hypothetical protein
MQESKTMISFLISEYRIFTEAKCTLEKPMPISKSDLAFFLGEKSQKSETICKCANVTKLQDRSNAPKFSDDIASLWMNVPTLDE